MVREGRSMTVAKLRELEAKATPGPIVVVDCRPDRDLLTLTDGISVLCRIENRVTQRPLDSEDEANAELIAYLRNHCSDFIRLMEAAEYWAKEYSIAEDSGELQHWPTREIAAAKATYEALAAFKEKP
jgi:hypothetical protein